MSQAGNRARFSRSAFWNLAAFGYVVVVSFFLSRFIVRNLGGTDHGLWPLLLALAGYFGLLDFGVRSLVTRAVADHYEDDDQDGLSSIVSAVALYGFIGLLAILGAELFAWFSPLLFDIPLEWVTDSRVALELGGLALASTMIGGVFAGVLTGLNRFDISGRLEIAATTVRAAAVVIALDAGNGLVAVGLIYLAVSVLQGAVAWVNVKRIYPNLRLPHARMASSRGTRAILAPVEGYAMAVLFHFIVRPLAGVLPREALKKVFGALAWLVSHSTFRARDMASSYRVAYGLDAAAARMLARRKTYWLIWEYALHVRGMTHPDEYLSCACEQVNREAVEKVLATGSSFIVAMGHFVRDDSWVWSMARSTLPVDVTQMIGPIPPRELTRPRLMNNRIHLNAIKDVLGVLHGGRIEIALVGELGSAARMIRKLKSSRRALFLMIDAPWNAARHRDALTRGFAGTASAPFGVGAARMARAVGCPILLCIPEYVDDTHCRLVWHDPLWVAAEGGHQADVAATNTLLDAIEQGIGRQPDRYLMAIGEERRWNGASGRWEDRDPAS